ncbi:MAG: hypothetical protein JW982_15815 [Spirochaetes bacterium]|nr:hypothetical protein [Spirochaetota bacterium]
MIEKIAYNLGRRDEEPNIELADEIIRNGGSGIDEIADGLDSPDRNVANDCIKVLYEVGRKKPELISVYAGKFLKLLNSGNNRLIWGAMMAVSQVVKENSGLIFNNLELIKNTYKNGSVITVDYSISIFAELCTCDGKYEKEIFPFLMNHLKTCRPKEVAQHAERMLVCINKKNADDFSAVLKGRYGMLTDTQKKRIDKLFRTIQK